MNTKSYRKINKKRAIFICFSVIIMMSVIQYILQKRMSKDNALHTSNMIMNQMVGVLNDNQNNEAELLESLKEDYIVRSKAVSYIIDHNEAVENNTDELKKIADLMSVDEIHIFDTDGIIYAGTNPEYYGFSFNSGNQIGFFLPMLEDRNLTMCQDITPNTAAEKSMMYAITWNESGTRMIQVGVEPTRLIKQLKQNEIVNVVSNMPMYDGFNIFVANSETGIIIGATDESFVGQYAESIGIVETNASVCNISGKKSYCKIKNVNNYLICVTCDTNVYSKNIFVSVLIVFVYLLIACIIVVYMLNRIFDINDEKDNQLAVLTSMSDIYYSMHLIDLSNNTIVEYAAKNQVKDVVASNNNMNASQVMREVMYATMSDEYLSFGLEFSDLDTLIDRMRGKKVISAELLGKNVGWIRFSFITIDSDNDGIPEKVLCTTQIIENEKRKEEALVMNANTDELTGFLNRRAYEDDLLAFPDIPVEEDFVYVSIDINGLKIVNDTYGHAAGDELIKGAAQCMKQCLGNYGRIYRTGGDEFVAMIFANEDRLAEIKADMEETTIEWTGKLVDSLSLSCGYVSKKEFSNMTVAEISNLADERMYEEKKRYYSNAGVDRRGQQKAHVALCGLYTKILKINLTDDVYSIINMDDREQSKEMGFTDKISTWLHKFGTSGQVHPDDLDDYLKKTDISFLREYFRGDKTSINIFYRRKIEGVYKQAMMEIIPADDYSDDFQSMFLYVKAIEN